MPTQGASGTPATRRYSDEEKAQAVRLVRQLRADLGTDHGTVKRIADQLGYGVESVRGWVRQTDIDDGAKPCGGSSQREGVGLHKAECTRGPDAPPAWSDVDEVELATLS